MNSLKNYLLAIMSVSLFSVASLAQEIEEIIVTANKREQTVQDIPMNISVLTSEVMTERGIYNPEDYLRTLAGVSTPGGDTYYTMRGLIQELPKYPQELLIHIWVRSQWE